MNTGIEEIIPVRTNACLDAIDYHTHYLQSLSTNSRILKVKILIKYCYFNMSVENGSSKGNGEIFEKLTTLKTWEDFFTKTPCVKSSTSSHFLSSC